MENFRQSHRIQRYAAMTMLIAIGRDCGVVSAGRVVRSRAGAGAAAKKVDAKTSAAGFSKRTRCSCTPRCMNCHPAGDAPLQGDDSHLHAAERQARARRQGQVRHEVRHVPSGRQPTGREHAAGESQLAPATPEMPLVFQGKTPRELAVQLNDPKLNGGKTLEQLLQHVSEDKLVAVGLGPGRRPDQAAADARGVQRRGADMDRRRGRGAGVSSVVLAPAFVQARCEPFPIEGRPSAES